MPIPDVVALKALLNAPSKSKVDEFFCLCATERQQLSVSSDRLREIAATFGGLSPADANRLQKAGANFVNEVVYYQSSSVEEVNGLLGEDFHAELASLIAKVALHRMPEWRAESLALTGISSMPRLQCASWQVYRKPAAASPSMLLSLGLDCKGNRSGSDRVNVEMSKEQLEALLESLSKVKEQLDTV